MVSEEQYEQFAREVESLSSRYPGIAFVSFHGEALIPKADPEKAPLAIFMQDGLWGGDPDHKVSPVSQDRLMRHIAFVATSILAGVAKPERRQAEPT